MRLQSTFALAAALTSLLAGALVTEGRAAAPQDDAPGPGVATSHRCAMCHSASESADAMRDAAGNSVAPYDLWRSTMMANSARDPFWRAVMSVEVAATPAAEDAIVSKCLRCHTPLADQIGLDDHGTGSLAHALDCEGELGDHARDGVSCTICHGISGARLGTDESFSGEFLLNDQLRLYGPHDEVFPRPMENMAGFTPHWAPHVTESRLCATCHTLFTHARDEEGEETGDVLHEQTPYLEWRNSVFTNEAPGGELLDERPPGTRTCQDCHMPTRGEGGRKIRTNIARNPGGFDFPFLEEREPFGRHVLVGGNAFMLGILRDNAAELGVEAPAEAFDASIAATREQLTRRTAQVQVRRLGAREFEVTVQNLTGHKLPTGHPSRRMWLEFVARDAAGEVVFSSGRPNAAGLIVGPDGAVLATERRGGPVEPHRDVVDAADEVARYRAVMADAEGAPTYLLIRGAEWLVDDRVLPRGWDPEHPEAARTLPYGATEDPDFSGERAGDGRDRVRYVLPEGAATPMTVEARLLYQTVSPRYLDELRAHPTPELERFERMYEAADRTPEVLATGRWTVQ